MLTELRMQEIQLKTLILTKLRWHFNWKHSCCTYKTVNVFQLKTPLLTKLQKHFSWKHSYLTYGTANAFQLKTLILTKLWRNFLQLNTLKLKKLWAHFNWKPSFSGNCETAILIENTYTYETAKAFHFKALILSKLSRYFNWKHSCSIAQESLSPFQLKTLILTKLRICYFNWKQSWTRNFNIHD